MQCGLFGKLPMKRDFVSMSVSRPFLAAWEPWLDAGLAESRVTLGPAWKEAFFAAPIWRFCLGPAICGMRVAGAVMPSVDAVGRCFPLTLVGSLGNQVPFARVPQESWFAAVEDYLLGTLAPEAGFAATRDGLARLETVSTEDEADADILYRAASDPETGQPLSALFVATGAVDGTSVWWTRGGAAYPSLAWSQEKMPAPSRFTSMLTGRFPAPAPTH